MSTQDSVTTERIVYIVWLDVQSLHVAPWNPRNRIKESTASFRDLLRSMRMHGFWWFVPMLISSDNMIIDGHRRWTAAQRVGLTTVPTMRLDVPETDLQMIWGILNGTPLKTNSAAVLQAVAQGFEPEHIVGRDVQTVVRHILATGGDEFLRQIVSYNRGTYAYMLAEDIARVTGADGDQEFIAQTTLWMCRHAMQYAVRKALDNPAANQSEIFLTHITADTPLKLSFA